MLRIIFIAYCTLLSIVVNAADSAPSSLHQTVYQLNERFIYTPEAQGEDNWQVLSEDGIVHGDCEDFALTIQKQLGGSIFQTRISEMKENHAIVCLGNGWCADTLHNSPFRLVPTDYNFLIKLNPSYIRSRLQEIAEVSSYY